MTLRNGDIIRVSRGIYAHYGIYAEGGTVIHYTGTDGSSDFKGVIRETSLREFLDGDDEYSAMRLDPKDYGRIYSGAETVRRARAKIGERGYNLFGHNCEHFALWCKTGEEESSQTALLNPFGILSKVLSSAGELFEF